MRKRSVPHSTTAASVLLIALLLATDLLSACLAWIAYAQHDYVAAAFFLGLLVAAVMADRYLERRHDERPAAVLPTAPVSDPRPRLDAAVRASTPVSLVPHVRDRVGGLAPFDEYLADDTFDRR